MSAKILLVDLETFPNVGYTWGKWEQNVIKFVKEWELAAFAYKWLDEKSIACHTRQDHSEKKLVGKLRDVLDEADIVIAHNGDAFDIKKSKAKFIQFGFSPPSLFRTVDTKKIAKSQFSFNSNSLNDLGETLGLGKKVDTGGFDLWLRCMANEPAAWAKMAKYNKQDVALLEKVYLKFRSWMPNHPSVALLAGNKKGCPTCGSSNVQARGFGVNAKSTYQKYQCMDCGHWHTGPIPKEKKHA
jgi:hypothetical protein